MPEDESDKVVPQHGLHPKSFAPAPQNEFVVAVLSAGHEHTVHLLTNEKVLTKWPMPSSEL